MGMTAPASSATSQLETLRGLVRAATQRLLGDTILVTDEQWRKLRDELRHAAEKWRQAVAARTNWDDVTASGAISSAAHTWVPARDSPLWRNDPSGLV